MKALIFPQPQNVQWLSEELVLAESGQALCRIVLAENAEPLERLAAAVVADAIAKLGEARPEMGTDAGGGVSIYVGGCARQREGAECALRDAGQHPEAYGLLAQGDSIALLGNTPAGTFYAAQTLRQMLYKEGDSVRVDGAVISDWPDFRYRGLYIESKWGPDLMSLQDWKDCIDYMAALKFNSLGIGVYACWCVQYEGKRTEFSMLPYPEHPELQTPKTIKYYSAKQQQWQSLTYLPRMFEEDFFGEVVAYAKSRNVIVRPQFNGPGHTTLIPHTHPEVAAKDEAGRPQVYGYCLSNPKTYELIFELWDSIIDRYLAPNGIDWFHMGLDEIYNITGADEENPERVVDPWCKCPACREKSRNELLQEYVIRATQHLVAKGVNNITIWNDHLASVGMLTPEFVASLEQAGVRDKVVLQWWRYDEPALEIPQDLGLRAWTTPMPGYWFWLFYEDLTSNIYPHLALAHRAGAEGADAYATFDPAFDRNYYCLAEYSWNQATVEDIYEFKSKYARKVTGASGFEAVEAFEKFDQAYGSVPWVRGALDMLLFYWHSYSRARSQYPGNVVKSLLHDSMRLRNTYHGMRTHLSRASRFFEACRAKAPDPGLIDQYLWECERLVAVVDTYEAILAAIRKSQEALAAAEPEARAQGLRAAAQVVSDGLSRLDAMMARAEDVKKAYLLPQILRDLSRLRGFVTELAAAVHAAAESQAAVGRLEKLLADLS